MENTTETDALWMEDIRKDSYISYNKLFARYYQPLCQFVYSIAASRPDAEDIVQELFLHLWRRRKNIEITGSVSSYLYKMAKNRTLNHIRKEASYKMLLERLETTPYDEDEHPMEACEFRTALYDCMNRLPARSREILLLDRMKGLKQKEIAERLSISLKTVKNQIWTSLQKLKLCLEHKDI
jgi:RNA polymerase sigma-70 factor (ECF subfamily)